MSGMALLATPDGTPASLEEDVESISARRCLFPDRRGTPDTRSSHRMTLSVSLLRCRHTSSDLCCCRISRLLLPRHGRRTLLLRRSSRLLAREQRIDLKLRSHPSIRAMHAGGPLHSGLGSAVLQEYENHGPHTPAPFERGFKPFEGLAGKPWGGVSNA